MRAGTPERSRRAAETSTSCLRLCRGNCSSASCSFTAHTYQYQSICTLLIGSLVRDERKPFWPSNRQGQRKRWEASGCPGGGASQWGRDVFPVSRRSIDRHTSTPLRSIAIDFVFVKGTIRSSSRQTRHRLHSARAPWPRRSMVCSRYRQGQRPSGEAIPEKYWTPWRFIVLGATPSLLSAVYNFLNVL